MNRRVLIVAIVLVAVATAGLIYGVSRSVESSYAGMGIPTENLVDRPAAASSPVAGVVYVANNGCFHLETSDGTRLGGRDRVAGEGWIRDADEVVRAADGSDGYMDMVMGYCADGLQVAVLREIG